MSRTQSSIATSLAVVLVLASGPVSAQNGASLRLGPDSPELSEWLVAFDEFGKAVSALGDLDADGNEDLLVGAPGTAGNGSNRGAVYVLFLEGDFSIRNVTRIDDNEPLLRATLLDGYEFGSALLDLGDLDANGTVEIAVGVPGADERRGAVWILSLSATAGAAEVQSVSVVDTSSSERLKLLQNDQFGRSLSTIGDLNGDGLPEIAVGAPGVGVLNTRRGAVWSLSLRDTGTGFEIDAARVQSSRPDFTDRILPHSKLRFGFATAQVDDFDGDGIGDIAVGAPSDEFARANGGGTVLIAGMDLEGVLSRQSVLFAVEAEGAQAGSALASTNDVDGNGVRELLVGAPFKSKPGTNRGEVYRLFLDAQGQVAAVDSLSRSLGLSLADFDYFGSSVTRLPDLDQNGLPDILVGSPGFDFKRGSVWIVFSAGVSAPTIAEVSVQPTSTPSVDDEISIVANLEDESGIRSAWLDLRRGGERSWLTVEMSTLDGLSFTGEVPKQFLGQEGFEYVIRSTNETGFAARNPVEGFHSARIELLQGVSVTVRRGSQRGSYRLIAFPIDLDSPGARLNLLDDLGDIDVSAWRFVRHSGGGFQDLADGDFVLEQGKAYWMIAGAADRTIETGSGLTPLSNTVFKIPLEAGWNLVGNPFAFELPIAALNLPGQSLDIRRFEAGGWSSEVQTIRPFEGYAVWNDRATADTLLIDPILRTHGGESPGESDQVTDKSIRENLLLNLQPSNLAGGPAMATVPASGSINSAFPNPTRNSVTFAYTVRDRADVQLSIYDLQGRVIGTILNRRAHTPGTFSALWGTSLSEQPVGSGLYILRLTVNGRTVSSRLLTIIR